MTREKAKKEAEFYAKNYRDLDVGAIIDQIYGTHEAELKDKDERIAELETRIQNMYETIKKEREKVAFLEHRNGITSKFIVDRESEPSLSEVIKEAKIAELEAMVQKMMCCENCDFYPPQKCFFNTQYGCLDGQIPSNWEIKQRKNDE